ncbi:hypothetical protein BDW22DRAFT_1458457 [Trametopsis cervina]|nr:hypothetical protein BDW22DRAFT_1458457 [Trametopsis cervina]
MQEPHHWAMTLPPSPPPSSPNMSTSSSDNEQDDNARETKEIKQLRLFLHQLPPPLSVRSPSPTPPSLRPPSHSKSPRPLSHLREAEEGEIITMMVDFFDDNGRMPTYVAIACPAALIRTGVTVRVINTEGTDLEPPTAIRGLYAIFRHHWGIWASDDDDPSDSTFAILIPREHFRLSPREYWAAQADPSMSLPILPPNPTMRGYPESV